MGRHFLCHYKVHEEISDYRKNYVNKKYFNLITFIVILDYFVYQKVAYK